MKDIKELEIKNRDRLRPLCAWLEEKIYGCVADGADFDGTYDYFEGRIFEQVDHLGTELFNTIIYDNKDEPEAVELDKIVTAYIRQVKVEERLEQISNINEKLLNLSDKDFDDVHERINNLPFGESDVIIK